MQSLKAALELGLEQEFEGSVDHLKTVVQEVPGDRDIARRRHLIIYDSVPGGTGYLAEILRQEGRFMDVLAAALRVLEDCSCNEDDEKDGCYQCLYAYRNAYDMPFTSRNAAVEVLREILEKRDQLIAIDTVDSISVNSVIESELEGRFLQRLRDLDVEPSHLEEQLVRGRVGFKLRIGDHAYEIEPQVEVDPSDGVLRRSRIDFVIHPVDANLKPIALFVDGLQYHRNRIGRDFAQRRALVASGSYHVWSLTWHDVAPQNGNRQKARNYLSQTDPRFRKLLAAMGEDRAKTAKKIITEGSFEWLLRLLQEPDIRLWRHVALAQALLHIGKGEGQDAWVTSAERLLPRDLAEAMVAQVSREGAASGIVDQGPDGADDPVNRWVTTTAESMKALPEDVARALRGITLALHLNTGHDQVPDNFGEAWNGFLRLYNLFQFIPEAYPVTSDQADFTGYHELMGGAGAADAHSVPHGVVANEEWRQAWDEAFDLALEETEALLSELRGHGAPPPIMPYELTNEGKIVAQAELGWPDQHVAVLLPDQATFTSDFEQAGWTAYALKEAQTTVNEVLEHLVDGVDTSP